MKFTIEELADKVNEIISEYFKNSPDSIKDARQSSVLSTRRIRDYITKGLLEKPVGNGREKWFDENHVETLKSIRLLQHNGLSEQYILSSSKTELVDNNLLEKEKLNSYSSDKSNLINSTLNDINNSDKELQNNALDFLNSVSGKIKTNSDFRSQKSNSLIASASLATSNIGNSLSKPQSFGYITKEADTDLLRSLNLNKCKQFNEYPVDENLGVFLKVDSKLDMELQKKLLDVLKKEVVQQEMVNHIKEKKND